MFRKPREVPTVEFNETALRPSTGRAPTPPSSVGGDQRRIRTNTIYFMSPSTPLLGRSKTASNKSFATASGKANAKGNGNITSFFKKVESLNAQSPCKQNEEEEDTLFVGTDPKPISDTADVPLQTPTPPRDEGAPKEADVRSINPPISRYNEDDLPNKKRRTETQITPTGPLNHATPTQSVSRGPFADDSESNGEDGDTSRARQVERRHGQRSEKTEISVGSTESRILLSKAEYIRPSPPPFKREPTSMEGIDGFDGIEDFIDEEFAEEGEEYLERCWMEEQGEIEMGLDEEDAELDAIGDATKEEPPEGSISVEPIEVDSTTCPICGGYTTSLSEQVSI